MRRIAAALMLVASTAAQAQTYDPVEILPTEIPVIPTTTQPVPTNLGDDATKEVELGFTFTYFGQDFTKAWISSNGFVSFQSSANLCCNGQPLDQAQRNTIYQYWTDLVNWTGTPYYSKQKLEDGTNSLLVGWYNTYEYGGNKPTSFEMYLYDTGSIVFNYINTYDMQYHLVTAGLTGPTYDDNIQLFYGSNTGSLSGKAYSFNYSTGTVTVDCTTSRMDPSCVGPTPAVTSTVDTVSTTVIQEDVTTQITTQQVEQVVEQQIQQEEAQASSQPVEEQVVASTSEAATTSTSNSTSTTSATTTTTQASSTASASRLSPEQLAALNSKGSASSSDAATNSGISSDSQQGSSGSSESSLQLFSSATSSSMAMAEAEQEQQKVEGSESKVSQSTQQVAAVEQTTSIANTQEQSVSLASISQQIVEEDKASINSQIVEQSSSSVASTESRWQESLASQSATLEALNSFNTAQTGDSKENSDQESSLGGNQSETIAQMAYVPGFSAYKLVSLPDRPEFYKPRRIYRNNRPVDAYMSIFKMTAANDNLWKQMVESQYE